MTSINLTINKKRYFNVVRGEVMKSKTLLPQESSLMGQLNNNEKLHQKYCENLIFEYNRSDVYEYDGNVYPELK